MSNDLTPYFVQLRDPSTGRTIEPGSFIGKHVDQLCGILFKDPRERCEFPLDGAKIDAILEWYKSCRTVPSKQLDDLEKNLRKYRHMTIWVYRVYTP